MKLALLILAFVMGTFAQQPDRWHGLILDQSSPEDAVKALGVANKDDIGQLRVFGPISKWVTKRQKEKIFHNLEFDLGKESGVQKATLSFLDGKLVCIALDVKSGKIAPNGLNNIYGVEFRPMISKTDLAIGGSRDFERNQGTIYPKSYPPVYFVAATSERSLINAEISNSSFGGILAKSMGMPDTPNTFPGKVEFVWLVSRTLENRDGADILK